MIKSPEEGRQSLCLVDRASDGFEDEELLWMDIPLSGEELETCQHYSFAIEHSRPHLPDYSLKSKHIRAAASEDQCDKTQGASNGIHGLQPQSGYVGISALLIDQ